jgi:cupin superfamily acireductone dioxygenase involved in methionine salvage
MRSGTGIVRSPTDSAIGNWQLLGSSDGQEWEVLMTHTDDDSLPKNGFSVAHWPELDTTKVYRCFRILTTGPHWNYGNNNRDEEEHHLFCAGFILFGVLLKVT